jgi:hypothetical protein
MRCHYEVLEVARDADADVIRKSYRKLALVWHPDKSRAPDAEERFKEIQGAYEILSEANERAWCAAPPGWLLWRAHEERAAALMLTGNCRCFGAAPWRAGMTATGSPSCVTVRMLRRGGCSAGARRPHEAAAAAAAQTRCAAAAATAAAAPLATAGLTRFHMCLALLTQTPPRRPVRLRRWQRAG